MHRQKHAYFRSFLLKQCSADHPAVYFKVSGGAKLPVQVLDIEGCNIGANGDVLAHPMPNLVSLRKLKMSKNRMPGKAVLDIAKQLRECHKLEVDIGHITQQDRDHDRLDAHGHTVGKTTRSVQDELDHVKYIEEAESLLRDHFNLRVA